MEPSLSIIGSSPTKESIIKILSEKWPLTAKKIHNILKKDYSLSLTYQATHKSLTELTKNNILEKTKQGYSLNKEWIKNLEDVSKKIISDLENKNKTKEIKTCEKMIFDNHSDFVRFSMNFIGKVFEQEKKLDIVFYFRHVPYPQIISNEEIKGIKQLIKKAKWTIFSMNKTPVDEWCAKQWGKWGISIKFDPKINADRLMVMNDYVMEVYSAQKSLKEWDMGYAVKSIHNFDAGSFAENILDTKFRVIVITIKDKEIADLLRKF